MPRSCLKGEVNKLVAWSPDRPAKSRTSLLARPAKPNTSLPYLPTTGTAKAKAQQAVDQGKQAVATQINNAAAQVRPAASPTSVAHTATVNLLKPVHQAIKAGAHAVRKAAAGTPAAAHVTPAVRKAHAAVSSVAGTHKSHLLHAAQRQHRARIAAMKTPPAGLVAPQQGGRKQRRARGLIGSVAHLGADFTGDIARGTGAIVGAVPVVGKYGKDVLGFAGRASSDVLDFAGRSGDQATNLLTSPFKQLLGKSHKTRRHSRHRRHSGHRRHKTRRHHKTHRRRRKRQHKTRHRQRRRHHRRRRRR